MLERFGRFRLLKVLGEGGMGVVYGAELQGAGGFKREVALKVLRPAADPKPYEELFMREGRALAALHHRNVVQVFELGEEQGRLYLAMEWIRGVDLSRALAAKGRLSSELAAYITAEIANGLGAAHEIRSADAPHGFVHGDLSPGNVMLGSDGSVKVLDFGLARPQDEASSRTATGGKLAYLAPEIAAGRAKDALTDVYALGVCLYQMVEGHKPFQGANDLEVLNRILSGRPTPPSMAGPHREWMLRLMHHDRKQRVGSAAEAARLAEQHTGALGGSTAVTQLVQELTGEGTARVASLPATSAQSREPHTQSASALPLGAAQLPSASALPLSGPRDAPQLPSPAPRSRWALLSVMSVLIIAAAGATSWKLRDPSPATTGQVTLGSDREPEVDAPPHRTAEADVPASEQTVRAAPGPAEPAPPGKLTIKFNRAAEQIWVDDQEAGRRLSGLKLELQPGQHTIRAKAGSEQIAGSVNLRAGETLELSLAFSARGATHKPKRARTSSKGADTDELVDPLSP